MLRRVAGPEKPAPDQPDPHRGEVVGRGVPGQDDGIGAVGRGDLALGVEEVAEVAAERRTGDGPHLLHARQRAKLGHDPVVERQVIASLGIAGGGRRQAERQHLVDSVPRLDRLDRPVGPEQEPAAHQQHRRQGDLAHHQPVQDPPLALGRRPAAGRADQRLPAILPPGMKGGGQSEEHGREPDHAHRERRRAPVGGEAGPGREPVRNAAHQQAEPVPAGQRAQRPGHQGQRQALSEELSAHPTGRGTQGGPDPDFPLPEDGSGQHHARDVGAGDQQHESDADTQRDADHPIVAHQIVAEREQGGRDDVRGIPRGPKRPVGLNQIGPGLLQRRLGAEPADAGIRVGAARLVRVQGQGQPEIGSLRKLHGPRHHAHDRVGNPVDLERFPEHVGPAGEPAPPVALADQHHLGTAGPVFLGREGAPHQRSHAQHRRQLVAGHGDVQALGGGSVPDVGPGAVVERHRGEGLGLLAPGGEVAVEDAGIVQIPAGCGLVQVDEPPRLRKGEGAEKEAVEQGEDGGVGRDAEAERQQDQRRHARLPGEGSKREAKIGEQVGHETSGARGPAPAPMFPRDAAQHVPNAVDPHRRSRPSPARGGEALGEQPLHLGAGPAAERSRQQAKQRAVGPGPGLAHGASRGRRSRRSAVAARFASRRASLSRACRPRRVRRK